MTENIPNIDAETIARAFVARIVAAVDQHVRKVVDDAVERALEGRDLDPGLEARIEDALSGSDHEARIEATVESMVDDAAADLRADLEPRVADVEARVDDLEAGPDFNDLASRIAEVEATLRAIRDAI